MYDQFDNIARFDRKGITTSFVWGYSNAYPIAKIENAVYNSGTNNSSSAFLNLPAGSTTHPYSLNFSVGTTGTVNLSLGFFNAPNPSENAVVACHVTGPSYDQTFNLCFGTTSGACGSTTSARALSSMSSGSYNITAVMSTQTNVANGRTLNITYPSAVTECYVENFEDSGTSGVAHSGNKYYVGSTKTINWIIPNARSYVISFWYHTSGIWKWSGLVPYTTGSYTMTGGDGYDDVRIHPADAQVTTYTYLPSIGLSSVTDPASRTTYFEYDSDNRLRLSRDDKRNIIKQYTYSYKQ